MRLPGSVRCDDVRGAEMACVCCGTCCRRWQPQLDDGERQDLSRNLGLTPDEFTRDYLDSRALKYGMFLIRHGLDGCIFLRTEGARSLCSIHRFKPAPCRAWVPGLSHRECADGLRRMHKNGKLLSSAAPRDSARTRATLPGPGQ